jgi:hypothetical protein
LAGSKSLPIQTERVDKQAKLGLASLSIFIPFPSLEHFFFRMDVVELVLFRSEPLNVFGNDFFPEGASFPDHGAQRVTSCGVRCFAVVLPSSRRSASLVVVIQAVMLWRDTAATGENITSRDYPTSLEYYYRQQLY